MVSARAMRPSSPRQGLETTAPRTRRPPTSAAYGLTSLLAGPWGWRRRSQAYRGAVAVPRNQGTKLPVWKFARAWQ